MFLSSTGKINQGYKEQSESTMSLHSEGHAILEPFPCYLSLYSFHWLYSTISLVSLLLLLCCFSSAALFLFCLSVHHPSLHHPGRYFPLSSTICFHLEGRALCRFLLSKEFACYSQAESVPIDRVVFERRRNPLAL